MILRSRGLGRPQMENTPVRPPTPPPTMAERSPRTATTLSAAEFNSNPENIAANVAQILARALQDAARPNELRPSALPTFSGLEHEDPVLFTTKIREYVQNNFANNPQEALIIAGKQLRGAAAAWYEPFKPYCRTYDEWESRVIAKFNDVSTLAKLQAKLYGETQREQEPVALFIAKKGAIPKNIPAQPGKSPDPHDRGINTASDKSASKDEELLYDRRTRRSSGQHRRRSQVPNAPEEAKPRYTADHCPGGSHGYPEDNCPDQQPSNRSHCRRSIGQSTTSIAVQVLPGVALSQSMPPEPLQE